MTTVPAPVADHAEDQLNRELADLHVRARRAAAQLDRWIEEPNPGGAEPESPAPVLTLAAAPAGAATSPSAAPTPSASSPATDASPAATPAPAADEQDAGTPAWVWLLVIAAAAAAAGGLWWALRRRRA